MSHLYWFFSWFWNYFVKKCFLQIHASVILCPTSTTNIWRCLKVALSQKIQKNFFIAKINIPNHYPEQNIWISCLLFFGRKFKFSAQDSDSEYLFWQWKNSPVSSDLKPPLLTVCIVHEWCWFSHFCIMYSMHNIIPLF